MSQSLTGVQIGDSFQIQSSLTERKSRSPRRKAIQQWPNVPHNNFPSVFPKAPNAICESNFILTKEECLNILRSIYWRPKHNHTSYLLPCYSGGSMRICSSLYWSSVSLEQSVLIFLVLKCITGIGTLSNWHNPYPTQRTTLGSWLMRQTLLQQGQLGKSP